MMTVKRLVAKVFVPVAISLILFLTLTQGVAFARILIHHIAYYSCSSSCTGHYPSEEGCNDGVVVGTPNVLWWFNSSDDEGSYQEVISLMWSQKCGTNWAQFTGIPGHIVWSQMMRDDNTIIGQNISSFPLPYNSQMIYSPNNQARACGLFTTPPGVGICTNWV